MSSVKTEQLTTEKPAQTIGKNIAMAMYKVANEVGWVEKTGNNTYQNYSYASELDLLMAIRPALMQYGVIVVPVQIDVKPTSDTNRVDAVVKYRFVHAESGEYLDVEVLSSGSDKTDKAAFKLMTGALKYMLRQSFLIATGGDPESLDYDSGKLTGPQNTVQHPVQKVIDTAKKLGIDLLGDPDLVALWKAIDKDLDNLTTSSEDMLFAKDVANLVRSIRSGNKDRAISELAEKYG